MDVSVYGDDDDNWAYVEQMKEAASNQFEAVGDATSAFSKGLRKSFKRSSKEMRGLVRSFGDMMDMEDVLKSIHKAAYPTEHARSSNIIHPSIDWSNPNHRRKARMHQTPTANALHSAVNISISNAMDEKYDESNENSTNGDNVGKKLLVRNNSTPSPYPLDNTNRSVSSQLPMRSASFSNRSREQFIGRDLPTRRHLDVDDAKSFNDKRRERFVQSERNSLEISDPDMLNSFSRRSSSFSNRSDRQYSSPPSSGMNTPTKELAIRHREIQDAKDLAERKREQLSLSARNSLDLSDSDSNNSQQSPRSTSYFSHMEEGRYESPPLSRVTTPTQELARKHREAQDAKDLAERKRERISQSARSSVDISDMDTHLSPRNSTLLKNAEGFAYSAPSSRVSTPTKEHAIRPRDVQNNKELTERRKIFASERKSLELTDTRVFHGGDHEKDPIKNQSNVYITRSPIYSQESTSKIENVSPILQEHSKYLEQLEHNPKSSLFRSNSPTTSNIKTKSFLQIECSTFQNSSFPYDSAKSDISRKSDSNGSVNKHQRRYTDEMHADTTSLLRVNGALPNAHHRHSFNGDQKVRNDPSLRRSASMRVAKSSARQSHDAVQPTRVCGRSASVRVVKQKPMFT